MEPNKETPPPQPPLIEQLREYAETRIKLAKYQAVEGGTTIAASLIADVAVFLSMMLAFIFASFTLAFFLGKLLGAYWMGFGCVAIIYFIIALVVKAKKKSLEKPIIDTIVRKIFKS